jgi:NADH:ubiquinone oxidoreductase subunit F (NADH-binding)
LTGTAIAAAPATTSLTGPLTGPVLLRAEHLAEHRLRFRDCSGEDSAALLDKIAASGLRGCGGAGFPAAAKLAAVRDNAHASGLAPIAVANGEEGEPGSMKDRYLLRYRPHLVLDGLAHACRIIGANTGYIYVSDPEGATAIHAAIAERRSKEPTSTDPRFLVAEVGHSYVAGEESALIRYIDGGPALPTTKPPRAYQHGIGGAPTLVANVETLAHIASIAIGTGALTRLVTISGASAPSAVHEVSLGLPLRELVASHLSGRVRVRAVLLGGLFGGIHRPEILGLPLDHGAMAAAGAGFGCGAIRLVGPDECPVAVVADALGHLAAESSRQCGVCVSGTRALADTLTRLVRGAGTDTDLNALERWAQSLPGRGACGLLDAAARLAGSLARAFPDLLAAHLGEGAGATRCAVHPHCEVPENWGVRPPCPGCGEYIAQTADPDHRPGDSLRAVFPDPEEIEA